MRVPLAIAVTILAMLLPQAAVGAQTDPNGGIVFAEPVVFNQASSALVGVLTRNTSPNVKTFTMKATFKNGDTIVATAIGTVNDLRPRERRVPILMSATVIPPYDASRVEIDTLIVDRPATPAAPILDLIDFDNPRLTRPSPGLVQIDLEVSNYDSNAHTFTVEAAELLGDQVIGIGSGAVNDLAPGQTKTLSVFLMGSVAGDGLMVRVATLVT